MSIQLTFEQARVLGCLIEKDMATPEYYPLSANALVNACNQKNNRDPITHFDEETVLSTIDELRALQLATVLSGGSNRVPKYGHRASEILDLNNREMAVVCVLLLRGPQTLNEIKTRTESLYHFDDHDAVENTLRRLSERAMAILLPKQPGTREPRWTHLLSGEFSLPPPPIESQPQPDSLASRVARLEAEIESLKSQFAEFRKQFE